MTPEQTVQFIRAICARELDAPFDYPYFRADRREGETPDQTLLRLFEQERPHWDSDKQTVMVMCHG
jgi:hypothetical protein